MQDILLNEDLDLLMKAGDFVVGEGTTQHKSTLLLATKGDIRQSPYAGVGLVNFLNDDNFGNIAQEIAAQYELDGLTVKNLKVFEDGTMSDESYYGTNG
jgi:hypothetical protein